MPGGQVKFFAEQIEILQDKNLLIASGNVVFQNPEGQIAADKVEFDIKNNTGTFHVASGLMRARDGRRSQSVRQPGCRRLLLGRDDREAG